MTAMTHSIENVIKVFEVPSQELRTSPGSAQVAEQLNQVLAVEGWVGTLLPLERLAVQRDVDVRLRALRAGRLPFPKIEREKLIGTAPKDVVEFRTNRPNVVVSKLDEISLSGLLSSRALLKRRVSESAGARETKDREL